MVSIVFAVYSDERMVPVVEITWRLFPARIRKTDSEQSHLCRRHAAYDHWPRAFFDDDGGMYWSKTVLQPHWNSMKIQPRVNDTRLYFHNCGTDNAPFPSLRHPPPSSLFPLSPVVALNGVGDFKRYVQGLIVPEPLPIFFTVDYSSLRLITPAICVWRRDWTHCPHVSLRPCTGPRAVR